jgi:UDP-N-acetyl-D-galactosamine dehydrogenase
VHDPLAEPGETLREYGVALTPRAALQPSAAVILAVAHQEYRRMALADLRALMGTGPVMIDIKGVLDPAAVRAAGMRLWRL